MSLRLTRHTQKDIPSLTGLRGVAIILVLLYHNFTYFQVTYFGWVGTDLFFVLSGFLITKILLSAKDSQHYFRNFYVRRVLRIFPLYYLSILMFFMLERVVPLPESLSFSNHLGFYLSYFQNLLFLQKSGISAGNSILNHFWSLSVEEHFYLLWPWLVFYLTESQLVRVGVFVLIASKLLSLILLQQGIAWEGVYTFSLIRFETLTMGSLLAILLKDRANFVEKYAKWVFCLSGLAILIFLGCFMVKDRGLSPLMPECCVPLSQSFIFSGLGLFFSSILVYALADNKFEKILSTRRLIFFGKYSYGIYIFHYPIYATATYCLHQYAPYSSSFNWPAEIMISVGSSSLALGIAYLSYHFYERHFLSLKTRFV